MVQKCAICGKARTNSSKVFLARLPLDPDRCRLWLKAIGQEDLVHLPIEKLHDLKYVCGSHFRKSDFNKSRTKLLKTAVPTLQLTSLPLPEIVFCDFPLHIGQYPKNFYGKQQASSSHDYAVIHKKSDAKTAPGSPVLKEITNLDATLLNRDVQKRKQSSDALEENIANEVTVKKHKRMRRSDETKVLNTKEKKLLEKLKEAQLNLRQLSRTKLDLDKLNNEVLKTLVNDAAANFKKKSFGQRWSQKTKLWALAICKRSPKTYRFLQAAIPLPSVRTLQRILQKVPLEPGINDFMTKKLKVMASKLSENDKYCALLFDEMSLKKRLMYNEVSDKIEGYEDWR